MDCFERSLFLGRIIFGCRITRINVRNLLKLLLDRGRKFFAGQIQTFKRLNRRDHLTLITIAQAGPA